MARQKGTPMFVKVSLGQLNAVLGGYPAIELAISKGNIAQLEAALGVNFGFSEKKVAPAPIVDDGEGEAVESVAQSVGNPLEGVDVD